MLRWASHSLLILLAVPILLGTLIAILPAFGYFPTLGGTEFSLDAWRELVQSTGH